MSDIETHITSRGRSLQTTHSNQQKLADSHPFIITFMPVFVGLSVQCRWAMVVVRERFKWRLRGKFRGCLLLGQSFLIPPYPHLQSSICSRQGFWRAVFSTWNYTND
ncbi:hypothetical protein BDR04DRAFT_53246 [Suillus decipiens]|nr:hypothetical protein BDR04DRAFT_53246 [Suillus decipiens]